MSSESSTKSSLVVRTMVIVAKFEVENVLLQREMRISLEEKPTEMEKKIIKQKKKPLK